jgi:hypothetical protein
MNPLKQRFFNCLGLFWDKTGELSEDRRTQENPILPNLYWINHILEFILMLYVFGPDG